METIEKIVGIIIVYTMARLRDLNIFTLKDEDDFENLCLHLWRRLLEDPNAQLNGRRGQRQYGVDIFGRKHEILEWVGVQCKVRSNGILKESDVLDDVKKAKQFNPRLSELIFATTAPRDIKLQTFARNLTQRNKAIGCFSVHIYSWDDIQLELSEERNIDICRRFYDDFFINYEKLGIAISRVLLVSIGVGHSVDTGYELLIGKTPSSESSESSERYSGLDYWNGNYFIANLNDKTMDTFPLPTFPSDLEMIFRLKRDAYIIAKWLTEMKSIDDLIYGDEEQHIKLITNEEYSAFLNSYDEL